MSLFSLPRNNYRLPQTARTICPISLNKIFDTDLHFFLAGTDSPHTQNEIHLLRYTEATGDIQCDTHTHFKDEIKSIIGINSDMESTGISTHTLIIGSKSSPLKEENCNIYTLNVCEDGKSNISLLSKVEQFLSPIYQIYVHPNLTNEKRTAVVLRDGFVMYTLPRNQNDIRQLTSISVEDEICHDGCFNPHNTHTFLLAHGKSISGWDIRTSNCVYERSAAHPSEIFGIDFNPNVPFYFGTSGQDGSLRFWDIRNLKRPLNVLLQAHTHWATSINYNPSHDQLILSTGTDNVVKLHTNEVKLNKLNDSPNGDINDYEISPLSTIKSFEDHEDSVYKVCWSGDDVWCFASISFDGVIAINHVPSEEKYRILL